MRFGVWTKIELRIKSQCLRVGELLTARSAKKAQGPQRIIREAQIRVVF